MSEEKGQLRYDDSSIRSLNPLEHIRMRPGMYIGKLGNGEHNDDGIYVLFKEVVDNSIDEFTTGNGSRIDIVLDSERCRVRDYGRGIPLGKVVDCVSKINTGGKFDVGEDGKPRAFSCSIGLNGVGLKAVNALSDEFEVVSRRDGRQFRAFFKSGKLREKGESDTSEENGTEIMFKPSNDIFKDYRFEEKFIRKRLQNYAWLNTGLHLYLNGEEFYSENGLIDLLDDKRESDPLYKPFHYRSGKIEFAMTHLATTDETYYSFANGQYTTDGGTHLSAFREGVLKAVNDIAGKTLDSSDVRSGMLGVVSIRLEDPIFESQTKNKLGNSDIRAWVVNEVKQAVAAELYRNSEFKTALFEKIAQNESIRKQIQNVKKEAKEQAKKIALKIPKLRDCKFHYSDFSGKKKQDEKLKCLSSTIFLTEGDSAGSNMIYARNPETQAVFPLRGKPYNVQGKKKEIMYKNEELYFIMQALGIEDSIDNLRYNNVVIASDADVDGFHIRLLLMTYFMTYFRPLVQTGHLYVLETPLFRVRNKKKNVYCYTDDEREKAIRELGSGCEITRFKGLGEISPQEFGQFIGRGIRLQKVNIDCEKRLDSMMQFYMGDNTTERRDFILDNIL